LKNKWFIHRLHRIKNNVDKVKFSYYFFN
jgi:hypothetical protein